MVVENPFGKMPAPQYGSLPFFSFMCLAYVIALIGMEHVMYFLFKRSDECSSNYPSKNVSQMITYRLFSFLLLLITSSKLSIWRYTIEQEITHISFH